MRLDEIRSDKDKFLDKLKGESEAQLIKSKFDEVTKVLNSKGFNFEARHTGNAIGNPHFVVYVTTPERDVGTDKERVKDAWNYVEDAFEDHRAQFYIERAEDLADGRTHYAVLGSIFAEYT